MRGALTVAAIAVAIAGGFVAGRLSDDPDERLTTERAGLCGVDPAQWRTALDAAAADTTSTASPPGGGPSAYDTAREMVGSGCLDDRPRAEVVELLGGDGEFYFLGTPPFAIDGETLVVEYTAGRVSDARLLQG